MKKIILLFVVIFELGEAQETLPIYQQYLFDGEFLFNPAHLGKTDDFVLNANYQKQFLKLEESPNIQSLGAHANVFDRVGAGITLFRDQNGPVSSHGFGFGASYFVPLGDDGRKDQFSFGTAVNFYNMSFDWSKINALNLNDPLLGGNNSIFLVYANLGLQASYRNFFAGVSLVDIPLKEDRAIVNGIEPTPTKFFINGGYDWLVSEDRFSFTPSFFLNLNTNSTRMLDFNLLANIHNGDNVVSLGASYRTENNHVGGQRLSLSPIIKFRFNRLTFGATYNFGLSRVQQYGGNSLMIGLGINLGNFINPDGMR